MQRRPDESKQPPWARSVVKIVLSLAVIATLPHGAGARAWAASPTEELRQYTDRVVGILQSPGLSPAARRTAVRDLALEVFDVAESAQRALGPHWQRRTPAEREEFVKLFRDLLEQTYVSRIDEYGGERVRYVGEQTDGDSAIVRARIVTRNGTEVPVESRMLHKGDRWLIYDVVVENVSLIANYRSQFDRIIRSSSYEELVKRLKVRLEALMQGKSERAIEPGGR
jgi:phospholipid transport system substrate-binding protein